MAHNYEWTAPHLRQAKGILHDAAWDFSSDQVAVTGRLDTENPAHEWAFLFFLTHALTGKPFEIDHTSLGSDDDYYWVSFKNAEGTYLLTEDDIEDLEKQIARISHEALPAKCKVMA